MGHTCKICGRAMKNYGGTWKCMTSPADHAKIVRANAVQKGAAQQSRLKRGKPFAGTPIHPPKKDVTCPRCGGEKIFLKKKLVKGVWQFDKVRCPRCRGKGTVRG